MRKNNLQEVCEYIVSDDEMMEVVTATRQLDIVQSGPSDVLGPRQAVEVTLGPEEGKQIPIPLSLSLPSRAIWVLARL